MALRKSASAHGPRSVVANKIKQQAHFSAMKNYQVKLFMLTKKAVLYKYVGLGSRHTAGPKI